MTLNRYWISKIKETRLSEVVTPLSVDKPLNIMFYSVIPWDNACVEHFLATALGYRGHNIQGVYCNYHLPICGMGISTIPRPECDYCSGRAKVLLDTFGLDYKAFSEYVNEEELNNLINEVDRLSFDQLLDFEYQNIPVAELAYIDHPQYFLGQVDIKENETKYRELLKSTAIHTYFALEILEKNKPDVLIVSNGKSLSYSSVYYIAKKMNIHVITWEETGFIPGGFIFNHNTYANEYHIEDIWPDIIKEDLENYEKNYVLDYFKAWQSGESMRFKYYLEPISNINKILSTLNIKQDSSKKIVSLFSNLVWDTSSFNREIAFKGMIDWIEFVVDYIAKQSDKLLIIRVHPGEKKLPQEYTNAIGVIDILNAKYKQLPENVYVIEGESEISSYALVENSDISLMYTSTLGLEMALKGCKVCINGDVHYRNKGFTLDINTKEELLSVLDSDNFDKKLSKVDQNLAIKYAYALLQRHMLVFPYKKLDSNGFEIDSFKDLLPGNNLIIDNLCNCIVNKEAFFDLNRKK